MAWADFFREDFNGAAGTSASGWVPTTDLPGKKWFISPGWSGTPDDAARAALDGSGAVGFPEVTTMPSSPPWYSMEPDFATRTGVEEVGAYMWYPYATMPKSVATEIQFTVPALTPAQISAGLEVQGYWRVGFYYADPTNGYDFNAGGTHFLVSMAVTIYRRADGTDEVFVLCSAEDDTTTLDGGEWSQTYPAGTYPGAWTFTVRIEYESGVLKTYHNGTQVLSPSLSTITRPTTFRPISAYIGGGSMLSDYNTNAAAGTAKMDYVLIQGDSVEVAAFVPPGGGGTSVTSSGAALTATASISGGSVVAGSNATAAGAALTATASILGGGVSSPGTVNQAGAALTATATISGGAATGLQYTPDGTLLIYDDFVGTLDSTPVSVVDGMAWGAKGTMEPASVDTTFFDNGATALKKALFFAGRKVFDFKYDYDTNIAGISQVLPSASRSTPGFAMTMSVVPAKAYKVRADMQERCVAQMFFAVETTEGLEMMRCAVSGFGPFALDNSPGQYCEIVLAKTGSNFEMYPPQRNASATITGLSNTVFKVRVEGQTVSAYLNGVLITGVRLPAPVVALHSFAFDVTSYNRVNYALVEAATLRPRVWAQTRGVYECA